MFVFLLNNVPVRGIIVSFALFNRIAPVLILESPALILEAPALISPSSFRSVWCDFIAPPSSPSSPPSSSPSPAFLLPSSSLPFSSLFLRARIYNILCVLDKKPFFLKKKLRMFCQFTEKLYLCTRKREETASLETVSTRMRSFGSQLFEIFT